MNTSKKLLIPFVMICIAFVFSMGYYLLSNHQETVSHVIETVVPPVQTATVSSGLTIQMPDDVNLYKQKMISFVQVGGEDPLKTQLFVPKYLPIVYTGDIHKASAEAAAQQFTTGGGPEKILVNYFKVQSGTAYISLNIDEDGRAGVSVSIAIIHPVVEKTLLQFTGIQNVVFGYASGDTQILQ
ncbi:MAG: hypothetical protein WCO66_02535 [Candidatus Absconditabacteria bacterium]